MSKVQEQYIVDREGHRSAVVVPIADYEELLEDLHDLAVIADRRDDKTVPHEELKRRLKADGLL